MAVKEAAITEVQLLLFHLQSLRYSFISLNKMVFSFRTRMIPTGTFILFLCSCQSNNKPSTRVEREGEPAIYTTPANDEEMIVAAKKARASLPKFLAILQNHDSTARDFAIKFPFHTENGKEYIWLGNLAFENGKWYGTVANTPEYTKQVVLGQKVAWDTSRVADWDYTSNDTLIGGYSIRLLRNRMSKEERAEFDKSIEWVIQ